MPRSRGQEPRNLRPDTHRRDSIVPEKGLDTYQRLAKLPEPAVCPECEAVFHKGRWTWMDEPPPNAAIVLCPACERCRDSYPAGFLTLSGKFLQERYDSVMSTIENEAAQETGEHPMHRIIDRQREGEDVIITTTDIHLPRRLGEAVRRAFGGELEYRYVDDDQILRASWRR